MAAVMAASLAGAGAQAAGGGGNSNVEILEDEGNPESNRAKGWQSRNRSDRCRWLCPQLPFPARTCDHCKPSTS
jgi:hypothetical protein